ncbi:unnamed protein product [Arabidopsis thaliana]|nr:unnamed protein product [Arabidopsis thaliana]
MRLQTVKHFLEPVLEPLIRKVVKEEVELALGKHLAGIKWICEKETHPLESRNLQLKFLNNLSLPVFTSARIEGDEGQAIRVGLIDPSTGQIFSSGPASSAKLEVFVVEGDFNSVSDWTDEDIRNNIITLAGLGAGKSFVVRDHRGELYKKHHPPSLFDEVWRLEKIGKDGAFHRRLNLSNINTVKDFLTHFHLNSSKLRQVLGTGMSSKMWEITLDHARSCVLDSSVHVYQAPGFQKKTAVVFNVVAQVLGLLVDFQYIPAEKLSEIEKAQAEVMVIDALSHLNEVISYDDEVSMMRNVLNAPASQGSVAGIDYSGLSLTSLDGYGFVSSLHNTAECSGKHSDDVDMEVTPHGLYEDYDNLWNCSHILGLEEPQSELQSALDDFMSQKNASVGAIFDTRLGMAFLLNNASISSHLRSSSSQKTGDALSISRRGFHIEPGTREKALLAEDSALKRFKSHKKSVHKLKRIGDVLTVVVVAGCCYEIYVKAVMKKEALAAGKSS